MRPASATVNGVNIRWHEHGEGAPLVLIHGIPTSPLLWRHVLPRIVGGRCFAWEMVGYGGSIPEGVGRDISVSKQAEYLLAWMAGIGHIGGQHERIAAQFLDLSLGLPTPRAPWRAGQWMHLLWRTP